jgi:alpha-D-ribose 1-methylphosphonate 5-triphosphate synthase subunit PhnG
LELDLSAVGTSDLGNLKIALAQVRENGTELVGSAMVLGGDPVMATAKAVLDALNRRLELKQ